MKNHYLVLLLLSLFIFNACGPEEFMEGPGSNPVFTTGNLTGLVTDESHQPISDAVITLEGLTTSTDENGVFRFVDAETISTGSLVNIRKEGFYEGFKFTSFQSGQNSILKIQLVNKTTVASFQSSDEKTINVNGAQLYLPENITTRADGTPYDGVVSVKAHYYDPTDENTISNMPSDLRGVDATGLAVQLTTYGMMAVELTGASGEELSLKEGMTARLTFPMPEGINGLDQIPMWHLDEATGIWIEEGHATKVGSAMVAEVPHFSFWNCDVPFRLVHLQGRLVSIPGDLPISGLQVVITNEDMMISGYGYTNSEGIFLGLVPQGINLTMSLFICGELKSFSDLGVLIEDTDLGVISLDLGDQINLNATLVDCNGIVLEEGFAIIETAYSLDIALANAGQINFTLSPCAAGEGVVQAYANDLTSASEEITFGLNEPIVNLETVKVCDGSVTEGITFSFKGAPPVTISEATVSLVDDTYLIIHAVEPGSSPLRSIHIRYFLEGASLPHAWSQDRIMIRGKFNNITYHNATIDDPVVAINSLSGLQVGDYVYGVIENHPTEEFNMAYNFKIDQVIKTPQVTGYVWVDNDGDGIREPGEDDPIPDGMSLYVIQTDNQGESGIHYYHTDVNPDGSYCIKGLAKDNEYRVAAFGPADNFKVTAYQQGTDTTMDNDFILTWENDENVTSFNTPFTLGDEEILPNIGLGLLK